MSTNINSTEQIVEINAGDQITNINLVSQSTTQVVSGEQVVTVDVNAGTIPAAWGSITGTLSNQTDLQNALNAKQNNITLTTTGTTGVATLVGATLNIPNYVTSTKQTEWDSAYNDKITSAEVSGTTTKTLTLNQQDGGTITASWSDFDTAPVTSVFGRTGNVVATEGDYNIGQMGDVTITSASNGQVLKYNGTAWVNAADASGLTSVGLAMPSAFAVSGSPLTSNGTITVTGAGTTSQYVRGDGSLAAFPSVSNEAKTLIREVYNSTGATLTKGTVVYINGGQGNLPTVTKALAVGDVTSAQTFGIVQSNITNMNNGFVVVAGGIDNIDTQAFTEGTAIYLSPTTAGAWTSTKPYAPEHIVYLGVIVRSHPTQGVIEVKIQNGYELDELHNVSARFPSNKDGIFYNSTTSVWENKSIAGVLGYTPVPETRIITINGTAQNLSADRTYNVGTVTNVAASGGTGISIGGSPVTGSGTITITNTAPDQVVSLTGAGTTTTSGTYPNFTITSNDQYVGTVTSVNATVPTGFEVSGVPITSSGTVDIKFASGYSLPTNAKQTQWDDAYAKRIDSLTVTGNSGSSTLTSNVLNVPTYTLTGLGGEPAITAGTTLQYWRGDKSFQTLDTSVVPENGPVYFTEPRVRATVLSGMNITGGAITASDNILNAFGKVQNQINGLIGGSIFQSTWNASTNVPALASGVGTKGYYYIVSTAGTTNLDGITDWQIGDWAIFDGTVWRKVDNTDAVVSVNGYTGIVSLVLDDLADVSAASPTSNQLLRFNGTSSKWENWTPNYLTTITLTGDVTGTGTSSIATTIGAGKVTNAMLAGSINYAKMDSATVPTWNQDTTGNAATADKWKTARTLTIGATGKSVDGSGNVSWSLSEIGAAPEIGSFSDANAILYGGFFYGFNPSNIPAGQSSGDWGIMNMPLWDQNISAENYKIQIASNLDSGANIFIRKFRKFNTVLQDTWYNLWNSGNDGSGSGLDADLLDGQHGTYYAAASSLSNYLLLTGGTLTGNITFNSTSDLSIGWGGNVTTSAPNPIIYSDQKYLALNSKVGYRLYLNYDNTNASSLIDFFAGKITFDKDGASIYTSTITASSFIKSGGTSSQYLMADGTTSTLTNPVTGTGTNNQLAYFNTTGSTIASLSTATYPSLTELSYVKGVTSAIQTQINSKAENLGTLSDANIPLYGGFFVGYNPSNIPSGQSNQDWGLLNAPLWGGNVSGENYKIQFAANLDSNTNIFIRKFRKFSTVLQDTWYVLWNSGNDGSDSGLDADLLDGQHGSYYATASSLSNYLPLSGGTLTGTLIGTTLNLSSNIQFTSTGNRIIGWGGVTLSSAANPTIYSDNNYLALNSKAGSRLYLNYDNTNASSLIDFFAGKFTFDKDGASSQSSSITASSFIKTSGTSSQFLKADGSVDTNTYITGNQTITLSGDVTGSGTTAITTTIGALKVTNAMLAGSINYSKMDSATVPTWNQNTTGSAATLTTARTLTIGSTGKTFNGSANVSWSISEIGAAPNNGTLSDANTLTTGGFFTGFNASNVPSGLSSLDMGLCNIPLWGGNSSGERYTMQLFANLDTNSNFYIRKFKYFGSVNLDTWFLLLHSGNYSSYALALSGGTMTGNINFNATGDRSIGWGGNTSSGAANPLIYSDKNYLALNSKSGSRLYLNFDNTNASSLIDFFAGKVTFNKDGLAIYASSITATSFFESSDIRLKSNIQDYKSNDVLNISAKIYEKDGKIEVGYLAQDLQSVLKSAVSVRDNGYLDLSYRQVHTAKIAALESKIKELENKLK